MEITETRKTIINFIEPYMNKTLALWCIIFWKDTWYYIQWNEYIWDNWKRIFVDKIIWHYDITAVIKFFEDKIYKIRLNEGYLSIEYPDKRWMSWLFNLDTKPLYLYTEEEDKQLLDLLTNLI